MHPASYSIDVLPPGDLVLAQLAGFFHIADVGAYAAESERLILSCYRKHGHYRMLLDVSACAIQSQEVIAAFIAHVGRMPVSGRSAVVIGNSVVRMQVRRVINRPNVALFENRAEAMAWIDARSPAGDAPA